MNNGNGTLRKIRNALLDIIGVYDGVFAYKGPRCVQIDLTNQCNNNCIGCWCNSPLLGEWRLPPAITNQTLPTDMVLHLLDELKQMGTEEIYFAGGGEPFMHPEARRIFIYAKQCGFHVSINTNFTLVTPGDVHEFTEHHIDQLVVSVWAGTPAVYAATHPNKNEDTFRHIKEVLSYLNQCKGKKGAAPIIKIYNVIFTANVDDFNQMLDFAIDTGSESVEFTLIDTVPGKTDTLLLTPEQTQDLLVRAEAARRQYMRPQSPLWLNNFETFLRRVTNANQTNGEYDRNAFEQVPCYAGWTFARIIANGDVNSCLKSHRIPIGNLHTTSFAEIWNNSRQQQFRKKTRVFNDQDPYFRFIGNDPAAPVGCYRSCDNIGHSLLLHNKIEHLNRVEKSLLKTVASCGRLWRMASARD